MLFKKRKSNQSGPSTPTTTIKKSRSARDFFLKLSTSPKREPQPDILPSTPQHQSTQDVFLTNILRGGAPPPPPPPMPTKTTSPQSTTRPTISPPLHLVPRILDFEIDSMGTSTPRRSRESRRDRHSEDTTDSIFDVVDKRGNHEEEEEGIDVNEDEDVDVDDEDEFMFFDDFKADSYSITETNFQIFKKYSHDWKSQQLQKTTTTTNGNAEVNTIIDNFLNDYEQDLDVEEEEEEEEVVDQAGLDSNEEIKKLEMLLIQEKQNYLIKQQQREIRHLQELLNAQNDLNKKLMRQLHRDDEKSQKKLLPPFTVMRRRNSENEDQEDNVSIVSNDSFIMSEHLISSRSTSLEQVHV